MAVNSQLLDVHAGPAGHGCDPSCSWRELVSRFPEERDCLAAFIALETAEVLAGAKPANLVCIANRQHPCGRNLYGIWQRHAPEVLRRTRLEVAVLRETEESLLLLFHRPDVMERRLSGRGAAAFLRRAGYPEPQRWPLVLEHLRQRFQNGFPHEVGLFLGYPLKDVAAFMGWKELPVAAQRLWKIFGHPGRSLRLADHYRHLRRQMGERLSATHSPMRLLNAAC